tara:strand:- start:597 stop:929 length:333 start_codon:yes stop_codon:yes gene_type:complete
MKNYDLPASIVADSVEYVMQSLATTDQKLKELQDESKRLRAEVAGIMSAGGIKSHRSVWGLVTLADSNTYTYSDNIVRLEIQLKAEREIEKKTGIAQGETKQVLKITYAK